MAETVLVTGGNGFVAGWCILELLRRGFDVRTTVRSLSKEAAVRESLAAERETGDRLNIFVCDLTEDKGWDAAVQGCDYVLHVASPLGIGASRDPDALIDPARQGTLRVLRAATNAGVNRVVMTSSTAAATPPPQSGAYFSDESVWTDPNGTYVDAYRKSKVLAERAAWDYMHEQKGVTSLTTILPAAILGPVLTRDNLGSVQFVKRLLDGRPPAVPRVGFCVVDVRDLADLQIRAMTAPQAAGERLIASGDFLWMKEIADTLRAALGERAAKVPTRTLPDFALRAMSWFVPAIRTVLPMVGRELHFSSAKAKNLLDFTPRAATATIVDCAESLLK